ncbi:MAG: hypothetical protein WDN67_04645 [Candidatus Moraniibacteriota bacterium]
MNKLEHDTNNRKWNKSIAIPLLAVWFLGLAVLLFISTRHSPNQQVTDQSDIQIVLPPGCSSTQQLNVRNDEESFLITCRKNVLSFLN